MLTNNFNISQVGHKFRLSKKLNHVRDWDCSWSPKEDAMLLIGVKEHGYGDWKGIKEDESLGLKDKIFDLGQKKNGKEMLPKATHISRRADYLLKTLREEEDERKAHQGIKLKITLKDDKKGSKQDSANETSEIENTEEDDFEPPKKEKKTRKKKVTKYQGGTDEEEFDQKPPKKKKGKQNNNEEDKEKEGDQEKSRNKEDSIEKKNKKERHKNDNEKHKNKNSHKDEEDSENFEEKKEEYQSKKTRREGDGEEEEEEQEQESLDQSTFEECAELMKPVEVNSFFFHFLFYFYHFFIYFYFILFYL